MELSSQLHAAVISENHARLNRLLSELLRCEGLTDGQRVAQQRRVFLNLLHCLRSVALNDDVTGLYNRRGFLQTGTRLLNLAVWDERLAYLVYLRLEQFTSIDGEARAQQMSTFMRELCPSYAAYDVLGRLGPAEFAALTMSPDPGLASREAILLRARCPRGGCGISDLPLSVGVARFDPNQPVVIDELLEMAQRIAEETKGERSSEFELNRTSVGEIRSRRGDVRAPAVAGI
jgi:GGDEF domain-containing protein